MPLDGAGARQRIAAEDCEIATEADHAADAIVHEVNITLMGSSDLVLRFDGHHVLADLSADAKARLLARVKDIITTKLAVQRCAGERTVLLSNLTDRSHPNQ